MISPTLPTIHILYENPAWIPPLQEGLENEGFQVHLIHVNEGSIDPSKAPEEGIWINRISFCTPTSPGSCASLNPVLEKQFPSNNPRRH